MGGSTADTRFLVVMSDDFGMCPAINAGVVNAFVEGVLTDANLMAPCPGFAEAASLARQHGIPAGVHATFACEWDVCRWGPLTNMTSIVGSDGYFTRDEAEAWAGADMDEAMAELRAQADAVEAAGITPTHVGGHMSTDVRNEFAELLRRFTPERPLPHKGNWARYDGKNVPHYQFASTFCTSAVSTDLETTKRMLKEKLLALTPGYHMWVCHAAADHPSLDDLCSRDWPAAPWARAYRVIDHALLVDGEVREWIDGLGISLVSIDQCPVGT